MKILITKLIGAALFLGASCSFANTYSVTNIPDDSSLTMRAWPSPISKPLIDIPANTQQIAATGKTIVLDTVSWLQISYDDKVGWVEASYLKQQAQEPQLQVNTSQEDKVETLNSAEVFSYSSSSETTPTQQAQTSIKPNSTQFPWSEAADTIYDDPKAKAKVIPAQIASTQTPRVNIKSDIVATSNTTTVAAPILQNVQPQVVTAIAPQPVILPVFDTPVDYREENINGNRYEAIETAATMGFIDN